ncbi:unnamed protein product [Adineta steineri]|uniref:Uncharacterized protein n=1 Tax=Adineta steineri TaxID=433720 RepID=A0A818QLH4_9BILA|nr:unnamed protein product [Adineta steineri]
MKVAYTSTSEEIIRTVENVFNLTVDAGVKLVEEDTGQILCSASPVFVWDKSNGMPKYHIVIRGQTGQLKDGIPPQ